LKEKLKGNKAVAFSGNDFFAGQQPREPRSGDCQAADVLSFMKKSRKPDPIPLIIS
jgi:hypothetical protein